MDYNVLVGAFIAALPATLLALATLVTAFRTKAKLEVIHGQIDGMKDELVRSTAKASKAEGKAEGVKEEQIRVGNGH